MPSEANRTPASFRALWKPPLNDPTKSTIARVQLLVLDDWGLTNLTLDQGRDLLEIIDDRHGRGSTVVTSQLPVENWHEVIANPTVADAILDRLVHNSHRLALTGESLRKAAAKRAGLDVKQDA